MIATVDSKPLINEEKSEHIADSHAVPCTSDLPSHKAANSHTCTLAFLPSSSLIIKELGSLCQKRDTRLYGAAILQLHAEWRLEYLLRAHFGHSAAPSSSVRPVYVLWTSASRPGIETAAKNRRRQALKWRTVLQPMR
jgi:hypothetical protein